MVTAELDEIKANLRQEREMEMQLTGGKKKFGAGYIACFKTENHILFRTLTGIFLQAWQQLTGIKYVLSSPFLQFAHSPLPGTLWF